MAQAAVPITLDLQEAELAEAVRLAKAVSPLTPFASQLILEALRTAKQTQSRRRDFLTLVPPKGARRRQPPRRQG